MRIGLTGGIGSGKSTVAALLVGQGATLIDTDAIARALAEPGGAAMAPIEAAFGAAMIDAQGGLDRASMRALVFTDASAKTRLEAIIHPLIGLECARQSAAAHASTVVFDVPLLVESGHWRGRVDRVLVIDAEESTQLSRVMARSGWAETAVRAVIDRQASRRARRAAADAVIFNDGLSHGQLADEVRALWLLWAGTASTR